MKFTVILPVYFRENPENLKKSVASLLAQTLLPDEIIIVIDGQVGPELSSVLKIVDKESIVKVLQLKKNYGVGIARKKAIDIANNSVIALMDSDDICLENRFEKQIAIIKNKNIDVVGAWIEEFKNDPKDACSLRKVPIEHSEIYSFGKWRMPVNNVTLMFKLDAYNQVGGYSPQGKNEDWDLIVKLLANGYKFYNIPEVLVYARAGTAMIQRRRGMEHTISGFKIFKKMYKLHYIGLFHLISNVLIRLILRLLPMGATLLVYRFFLRNNKN